MLGTGHARPRGGTMTREVPISDEMAYLIINACRHRARQLDELIDTDALAVDDVPRALHTEQEYLASPSTSPGSSATPDRSSSSSRRVRAARRAMSWVARERPRNRG